MNNALSYLFQTFASHGKALYIVGGAVRDALLGEAVHDYDLCTDALPNEMTAWFDHTVEIGRRFGTIGVILDGNLYEITTFRSDKSYSDSRHPDQVVFSTNVQEDVQRRDFTINSLLLDQNGVIIDYTGGLSDLSAGLIRAIGNPSDRFNEDCLRKWRCVRLAAEKRMEIEPATKLAIKTTPGCQSVSIERIQTELNRILLCDRPAWGGYLLVSTGLYADLLNRVLPDPQCIPTLSLIDGFELAAYLPPVLELRLAALLLNLMPTDQVAFLKAMRYSNALSDKALHYAQAVCCDADDDIVAFKKMLADFAPAEWERMIAFQRAFAKWSGDASRALKVDTNAALCHKTFRQHHPLTIKELAINGNDLQKKGLTGKAIGQTLNLLRDYVLRYPEENTKEKLYAYLEREYYGKIDISKSH